MKYIFIILVFLFASVNSYSKSLDLDISGSYVVEAYSLFKKQEGSDDSISLEHSFTVKPSWLIIDHWSLHSRLDFLASELDEQTISLRGNIKSGSSKINKTFLSSLYLKYDYKNHGGHVGVRPLSFGLGLTHNSSSELIPLQERLVFSTEPSLAYWLQLGSIKVEAWHIYFKKNEEAGADYKSASSFKLLYGGEAWSLNYLYYKDLKFSSHNVFAHKKTQWVDTSLEFVLSSPLEGEDYTRSAALLNLNWGFNFSSKYIKLNNSFIYASGDVSITEDIDESYAFSVNKFMGNLFVAKGGLTNSIAASMGVEQTFFNHFTSYTYLLYAQALEGVDKDLGFELSTSISYSFNKRLSWSNQLYVLLPGKALKPILPKNSLGFSSIFAISF